MNNRILKFRAWYQEEGKPGEMIHFSLFEPDQGFHIEAECSIDDCPIMQFTGFQDVNGTDIYEGDQLGNGNVVEFVNGGFCVNGDVPLAIMAAQAVTGNIYAPQAA